MANLSWFRVYNSIVHDPKVQRLDGRTFKFWINSLALVSENGGNLPPISDVSFALRLSESKVKSMLNTLVGDNETGLYHVDESGTYTPHNWGERQFKSDSSTDRVKRFRKRFRNAQETADETPPDTDTDTDNPPTPYKGDQKKDKPAKKKKPKPVVSSDPANLTILKTIWQSLSLDQTARANQGFHGKDMAKRINKLAESHGIDALQKAIENYNERQSTKTPDERFQFTKAFSSFFGPRDSVYMEYLPGEYKAGSGSPSQRKISNEALMKRLTEGP